MRKIRSYIFNVIDFTCVALFAIGLLLFSQIGKPYKRGFFCNDESIQKPYKDSTVSSAAAAAVGFVLALVVIVITEIYAHHQNTTNRISDEPANSDGCTSRIPQVIKSMIWVIFVCLYGAAINQFITDVGKYSVGRLRPHFLDVCKPEWSKFNCTDERGNYVFITDDFCTVDPNTKKAKETRLSFPSGHSSFSAYMMVFLALYIQAKLTLPRESGFLKIFIQTCLILLAFYTGLSRVSDYKHHWSDVLAGFALGTTVAFIAIFGVLKPRFGRVLQETESVKDPSETANVMMDNPKYTTEIP